MANERETAGTGRGASPEVWFRILHVAPVGHNAFTEADLIEGDGFVAERVGGGIEIVWRGLHMVNYAWIKRIPPTALTAVYHGDRVIMGMETHPAAFNTEGVAGK